MPTVFTTIVLNVQVSQSLIERIQKGMEKTSQISNLEKEFKTVLVPIHPHTKDKLLAVHYRMVVSNQEDAEKLKKALLNCEGIDAAYIKPMDELP